MEGDVGDAVLLRHVPGGVDDRPVLDGVHHLGPGPGGEAGQQPGSCAEVNDLITVVHVLVDCREVGVHAYPVAKHVVVPGQVSEVLEVAHAGQGRLEPSALLQARHEPPGEPFGPCADAARRPGHQAGRD